MNLDIAAINYLVSKLSAESTQSGVDYNISYPLLPFKPCMANRTLFRMNCMHQSSSIQFDVCSHIDISAATLHDCTYVELTNNRTGQC